MDVVQATADRSTSLLFDPNYATLTLAALFMVKQPRDPPRGPRRHALR